jgi:HEAT repeat protein
VDVLIGFVEDENLRVRTAAFISLIDLSPSDLTMDRAIDIASRRQPEDWKHLRVSPYLIAAAEVFLIVQSPALSDGQKQDKLIELSSDKDGATRRMAVEGLRAYGDVRCLPALAERSNDNNSGHDDTYDMRAVSRIAFDLWWKIKSASLNQAQQISTIIVSLEEAQPFSSSWADAACKILEDMGNAAVPQLIEVYEGKPGNARAWAARTLRSLELRGRDRRRVRTIAMRDLQSKEQSYRRTATYLLERFSEQEDLSLYIKLLTSHDDPFIRNFATRRLGELGGAESITALKEALAGGQMQTRVLAAKSLAALGENDGHTLLLESLGSLDSPARSISLDSIQYLDQDLVCNRMLELIEAIEEFESDDERQRSLFGYARASLFRYIDKMPAHRFEPAIPTLKKLLKYPNDSISRPAARLLKKLGVTLKWKYDIGQKRGWFEVVSSADAEKARKTSVSAKKTPVTLPLAERQVAEDQLKAARAHYWRYWAVRENQAHDSQQAMLPFERAVSALSAFSEKYAGSKIDAQAKGGLFKLFHLAGDDKRSSEMIKSLSASFGAEHVSDAYFGLGIDYLQRANDPRRALAVFKKIPMPPAPNPNDKSDKGLHNYELTRHTYAKVQQPMAKCEVQLGDFGKAERRYARLIELFPESKESFQRSLEFEIKSIATRRTRNKYWLSLSGLKQKRYQQKAARWLEDYKKRREQAEQE